METNIQGIVRVYKQYLHNLKLLKGYIDFNKENESAHYRNYREIVYGAIINRAYSLWETYSKELFYEYFSLNKEQFINDGSIISRYRIHELPAYLLENANFHKDSESLNIELTKEILVFTSKNIELRELNNLYNRIDVPIVEYLEQSDSLKTFMHDKNLPLEEKKVGQESSIARALKRIINERNRTAHDASIDDYQDMDTLEDWVDFFEELGFVLYESILLKYINLSVGDSKKIIGTCKKIIRNSIGCYDIDENISLEKDNRVLVYKTVKGEEKLVDVLLAQSFMVNNEPKDKVEGFDKAGIVFESLIYPKTLLKPNYKYFVRS